MLRTDDKFKAPCFLDFVFFISLEVTHAGTGLLKNVDPKTEPAPVERTPC